MDRQVDADTNSMAGTSEKTAAVQSRFSAGFFDKDPVTVQKRSIYLKIVGLGSLLVILVIFGVLSIYWGGLWKVNFNGHHLKGWVVDFDQGVIGSNVSQAVLASNNDFHVSWSVVDPSIFPNGEDDVIDAIVHEKVWAIIAIHSGSSTTLDAAIKSANASYDGSLAVTAYAAEARNENSYPLFILPSINEPLLEISSKFAAKTAQQLSNSSSIETLLRTAPNVITQPLFFTINNVRPFDVPVATAVDFVGLIYLLIISFVIAMMNYNARVVVSGLGPHLRLRPLLLLRIISPITLYFFLSLFFSLLSLAFQVPFDRKFGHGGFMIYWMMCWAGMCALGLAMEAMITLLTPAFTPFFLILWIISNVTVCFFPIELLPGVFRYGYATPFYNVSRTVRAIVFNTRDQIGLNFGVQFAWIGISLFTITAIQYLLRKREVQRWVKEGHGVQRV